MMPEAMIAARKPDWTDANQANINRRKTRLERTALLALGGATSQQIADDLGVALATIYKYKAALRRMGRLGCCMQPCHSAPDSDATRCKWYVP